MPADHADTLATPAALSFEDIFEHADHPMVVLDDLRSFLAVNRTFVDLVGHARPHLMDMQLDHLVPPDGLDAFPIRWEQLLERGGGRGALELLSRPGAVVEVLVTSITRVRPGVELVIMAMPDETLPFARAVPILHPLGAAVAQDTADIGLSEREQEVLWLVADGATNYEIAYGLGIVEKTVQKHIASIKTKLGAATRAQVVALALRDGIPDAAMTRERTIIHEAIRDADGSIVDTLVRYISHDSRLELPGVAAHLGRPTSSWYPGWTGLETFRLFVTAVETGAEQRFHGHMRLAWEAGPRAVAGRVTRLGPDRAAFVTRKTSGPLT